MLCPTPACLSYLAPQFLELLRSHQNRPAKCLTIMWALGQAGFANLTEGLKGNNAEGWAWSQETSLHCPSGSEPEASSLTFVSTVWLGIMLPVLGIKSLSPFAIAYLDRLLL